MNNVFPEVTILIVEDDEQNAATIEAVLSTTYQVIRVNNAESAYSILASQDVGVMICTEYLPGENGLIFMARMSREFPKTQPVLMSEGITEDLLAFAINDVGVLKYLKKPISEKPLLDAINGACEHYLQALVNETLQSDYQAIVKETQSLPYMARRIKEATPIILSNIGTSATAASGTMLLMFALIAVLGFSVILGIYSFKSLLGIDFFTGSHITDLFE